MFAIASILAVASAAIPQVLAHGGVLSYSNAGNWYQGWAPYNSPVGQTTIQRPWSTYNPITDPTDPTLACNDDGTAGALQLTATVEAGSAITAYWNQVWPHPYGPMLTYLAQCPGSSCTDANAKSLKWFKIDEAGLLSGTIADGYWGSGKMIDQNSSWTTTIPSTVPSGNYLIRFETIALHSLPAQFYPECAQIQITGGGSRAPTSDELVTFPGAYSASDPGLTVDLYDNEAKSETTYVIPGPPLYGSGTGAPAPPPVSRATTTHKIVTILTMNRSLLHLQPRLALQLLPHLRRLHPLLPLLNSASAVVSGTLGPQPALRALHAQL
ncbi:cellulose-growth-specific protein [Panus rudis PR-1116 ss-1]|nr:cellulose-growth-specific protein [Panus rudis PR-1116 ss-1]